MEWLSCIRDIIKYIEDNLMDENCAEDVLRQTYISPMLLQKGFQILTGYTITSYIRNRRLYLAACELQKTNKKVIDIALDYGSETPESFTKAFTRFHGCNPTQARNGAAIQIFLPLKINISVQGGNQIECKVKNMSEFSIVGYVKEITSENAHEIIPEFWDEVLAKDKTVGEYAVCMDDLGNKAFHYMIGKEYDGGIIPEGMSIYKISARDWAIFECQGENPAAIQELDQKIWKEWLPGNSDYELCGNANIEWYGNNNHSAMWIPVRSNGRNRKMCRYNEIDIT